jgi:beta-RFAP synthase
MCAPLVEVAAPSRLHFGMFSFGDPKARQYGGAGVMIERPGLVLRISPDERFSVDGPLGQRVRSVVERLAARWELAELPACRVHVLAAPPEHVGLGTGTQLALSVTTGLNAFRGGAALDAAQLAALGERGARSAIGTHGFLHGGFLVESGKLAGRHLSPLEFRADLPDAWRFVLVVPARERGLSGEAEHRAFRELPPVPPAVTAELRREVAEEMIPAAAAGDFARFSQSVYRFGCRAGMCFSGHSPFSSPRIAAIVESIRAAGVEGVGQSSWGPTVFALVESESSACKLADAIGSRLAADDAIMICAINCGGARITRRDVA